MIKKWGFLATVALLGIVQLAFIGQFNTVDTANGDAIDYGGIYISRISSIDTNEWIEIHNSYSQNVEITTLELQNYNTNGNLNPNPPIKLENGLLLANSYTLIKRTSAPSAGSDYEYSSAIVPMTSGGTKLYVNGVKTSDLCWGSFATSSAGQACQAANLTFDYRNPSLTESGHVNVSECELIDLGSAASCNINKLMPVLYPVMYTPGFGGFIPDQPETPDPGDGGGTEPDPDRPPQYCRALQLSEVSTNEQWIELYNSSDFAIRSENLDGCILAVQYGDKTPPNFDRYRVALDQFLGDGIIARYDYILIDVALTDGLGLPKSVSNRTILIHDTGADYSEMTYSSQKNNTSLAYFSDDWKTTYAPTPGAENIYQQWQSCDVGKHINEKTGNCVKDTEPPAECAENQFRNPATGRCKKLDSDRGLAECAVGQFRNPLTNRCKKLPTADDLKLCAEGYERNPETNRCRKVVNGSDAQYALDPMGDELQNSMWVWLGGGGLVLAGGLIIWQFRSEISRLFRRMRK